VWKILILNAEYLELVRYLKENKAWSYAVFLNCHRDTILTTVRPSDSWLALDSTWTRRYLFKAKEFNPANFATLERKVTYLFIFV